MSVSIDRPDENAGSGTRPRRALRPRLAASLIVIDRSNGCPRVLLGRRSRAHVFMPGFHVFPGGRRDAGDHRLTCHGPLSAATALNLGRTLARRSPAAARAVAIAALRELHEETGIAVGQAAPMHPLAFLPDITNLRYIARAITPPGFSRRYDTHFFALFTDTAGIDPAGMCDSAELEDLGWFALDDLSGLQLADITQSILGDVRTRLGLDPHLALDGPVAFYHTRHGRRVRDVI